MSKMSVFVLLVMLFSMGCTKEAPFEKSTPAGAANDGKNLRLGAFPAGISKIWAIDDGEKISKTTVNNPLATDVNNKVWYNDSVHIFGGRNEIVSFQLIIETNGSGINGADVSLGNLTNGTNVINGFKRGTTLSVDQQHTELLLEKYINVTRPSGMSAYWARGCDTRQIAAGWIPDPLMPFVAGQSISIAANNSQAVWVDIYIPKTYPAGIYKGSINVTGNGVTTPVPITLQVYNLTIPDQTHTPNIFGVSLSYLKSYYSTGTSITALNAMEKLFLQMGHRHRMDLGMSVYNLPEMTSFHYKYLSAGAPLYTLSQGYAGPGTGIPNNIFAIGAPGMFPNEYGSGTSQSGFASGTQAWYNWFTTNAPQVKIYKYASPDEPSSSSYAAVNNQYNWTPKNSSGKHIIPSYVTHDPDANLSADFWAISAGGMFFMSGSIVTAAMSAGKQVGFYNGYSPANGEVLIDFPATDFRVNPWITWKYNMNQYFYWSTTYWPSDPLNNSVNVFSSSGAVGNGDGTLFYPGSSGPIASIRMKNWRRGAQDCEYLWLAKQKGISTSGIVNSVIPYALWEAYKKAAPGWAAHGYTFESYRRQLADLLK